VVVKMVEHFRAEIQRHALRQLKRLAQRKIRIPGGRSTERVPCRHVRGNGPKVSMHPSHAGLQVESAPGSVKRLNSLGFPDGVEPLASMLVIVPFGV